MKNPAARSPFLPVMVFVIIFCTMSTGIAKGNEAMVPAPSGKVLTLSDNLRVYLPDDHKPAADQPFHTIKFVRKTGSAYYEALCCPGLIGEDSMENSTQVGITSTPEEVLPMADITVYPNPASDYLIVKNAHGAQLYLFTCMGKQIHFAKVEHEQPIDITSVPCGCYTLKLELGNRFRSLQLTVRR